MSLSQGHGTSFFFVYRGMTQVVLFDDLFSQKWSVYLTAYKNNKQFLHTETLPYNLYFRIK